MLHLFQTRYGGDIELGWPVFPLQWHCCSSSWLGKPIRCNGTILLFATQASIQDVGFSVDPIVPDSVILLLCRF